MMRLYLDLCTVGDGGSTGGNGSLSMSSSVNDPPRDAAAAARLAF